MDAVPKAIQGKIKKHRLLIGTFYKILENSNDQIIKTPVLLLGNLLELFFKLYWERDVSSGLIRLDGHVKSLPCFLEHCSIFEYRCQSDTKVVSFYLAI